MSENTVYVIQDVPGKNLLPAKEFGKLHVMLSGKETVWQAQHRLTEELATIDPDDFLLLIGSPINIALAAHVAFTYLQRVQFLVWNRTTYSYDKVEIPRT